MSERSANLNSIERQLQRLERLLERVAVGVERLPFFIPKRPLTKGEIEYGKKLWEELEAERAAEPEPKGLK